MCYPFLFLMILLRLQATQSTTVEQLPTQLTTIEQRQQVQALQLVSLKQEFDLPV